jgi:hypothetical protein
MRCLVFSQMLLLNDPLEQLPALAILQYDVSHPIILERLNQFHDVRVIQVS